MATAKKKERNEIRKVTDEERNAKLAEAVARQHRKKIAWEEAIDARSLAQSNEKTAKEEYLESCKISEALLNDCDENGLPFDGDEQKPSIEMPDTFDEKALRGARLSDLKNLSTGIVTKLQQSDEKCGKPQLLTVGDLQDWLEADPGNRIANINGLGESAERKIEDAIKAHVAEYEGSGAESA
ncbi:MAG: hypothetical protein ACIAQF_05125 [Phycisphaerales bacterium JB065]